MGREHLGDYFWSIRKTELGPLRIEPYPVPQSQLYRLSVIDKSGIQIIDSDELDLQGFNREAGFLERSLTAKGYEVSSPGLKQSP
jgi:hypothetical protein